MTLGMSNHPNVVQFHTSFLVEETLWLIMDFMAAGKLLLSLLLLLLLLVFVDIFDIFYVVQARCSIL
jgi:serine/threonine protein kinase